MKSPTSGTGSVPDALLVEVFYAYRQGLLRQAQPRSPMPPRDFEALKFLGTVGWLPLEDRWRLRRLHIACGEGLAAARQGRLDDAIAQGEQAREHLDRLAGATRLAWFLGVSTYEAGVAYLDFKMGRIELACLRLDRAMDADLELEQAGLPVMQIHRIQQGHNLARMDFRLGRREEAVGLAGMLLAYMERRVDELPFHRDWRSRSLQAVPRSLLQAMIYQIIGEAASFIVADGVPAEEWRSLIEASQLRRTPETAVCPQVQYALWAQCKRLDDDPVGYLRDLERFFRLGIRHCHLLWYAILIDLVGFCGEMDTRCSYQVRDRILRDSAAWRGLPPFLRHRFDAPLSGQRVVA